MNGVFSTLLHLLSLGSFGPNPDSTGFNFQRIKNNGPQKQEHGLRDWNQNSLALQNLRAVDLLTSARFKRETRKVVDIAGNEVPYVEEDVLSKFSDFSIALLNKEIFNIRLFSRLLSILLMVPVVQSLAYHTQVVVFKDSILEAIYTVIVLVLALTLLLLTLVDAVIQVPEETLKGKLIGGLVLIGTVLAGIFTIKEIRDKYQDKPDSQEKPVSESPVPSDLPDPPPKPVNATENL